ncbi:hypothetical protein K456DRAFT_1765926 [Colletotrichum gloeosporioides 23]|nr:hypothetical protein K456DRAFT_1765926 [Colletotrichum gloeosporioides 23]
MSGVEVAGLVLGIVPLALQAISRPANFFRSLRDAIRDLRAETDDQLKHESTGPEIKVWDESWDDSVITSTQIPPDPIRRRETFIDASPRKDNNEVLWSDDPTRQPNGTIRIHAWGPHSPPCGGFDQMYYSELFLPGIDRDLCTTRFLTLLSPCRRHGVERWHRFESYHMLGISSSGDVQYALVEKNLIYRQKGNEQAEALILCRTYVPERPSGMWSSGGHPILPFVSCLRELNSAYRSIGNISNWRHVFTLRYIHANLVTYAGFLLEYEEIYKRTGQHLFDPRRSKFKQGHLKLITRQSSHIQKMGQISDRLRQAAEATISTVRATLASDEKPTQPSGQEALSFQLLELEIRGYCDELRGCITRLSTSLEHDLKFLGLNRDMEQADSVQQLTILATIFLPLSLAAAVLSMQTRFKDLGVLIYDFIGITVLLGALVVPFILFLSMLKFATGSVMVRLEMRMAERDDSKSHDYLFLKKITRYMVAPGMVLWGALILASFLIGMFKNVKLGCMILGYGTAGMIGVVMIVSPIPFVKHFFLGLLLGDRRQPQEIPR